MQSQNNQSMNTGKTHRMRECWFSTKNITRPWLTIWKHRKRWLMTASENIRTLLKTGKEHEYIQIHYFQEDTRFPRLVGRRVPDLDNVLSATWAKRPRVEALSAVHRIWIAVKADVSQIWKVKFCGWQKATYITLFSDTIRVLFYVPKRTAQESRQGRSIMCDCPAGLTENAQNTGKPAT